MKETSFLRYFVKADFFISNFEEIDNYIKRLLDSPFESLDNRAINELKRVKDALIHNSVIMGEKQSLDFSANLELVLFRFKEKDSPIYQNVLDLANKKYQEEELVWTFKVAGDYKSILKNILFKGDNFFEYSDETINIIKTNLENEPWYKELIKEKSIEKATQILDNIEKNDIINENTAFELESLLHVLKYSNLKPSITVKIVEMLNKYNYILAQEKDTNKDYYDIIPLLRGIKEQLLSNTTNNITYKLVNGNLNLSLGEDFAKSINILNSELAFVKKRSPIITLDDVVSPDLDSAFSIVKQDDLFFFDVYVTDVPSFLKENRELSINAFRQGSSFYLRNNKTNINYDMLPKSLSHDYLSMTKKTTNKKGKDAICFHYIFDKNGNICSLNIVRKKVVVDFNLFKDDEEKILKSKKQFTLVDKSLFLLRDLCKRVGNNNKEKEYLAGLRRGTVSDMIAFPSVLINYSITNKLEFGIYRNQGVFTTLNSENSSLYARGGAPLRRYADDINLAILLEQENLQRFAKDDFRYLENNLDEIVEHLNEQDNIEKYLRKNNELVKRYYLKK